MAIVASVLFVVLAKYIFCFKTSRLQTSKEVVCMECKFKVMLLLFGFIKCNSKLVIQNYLCRLKYLDGGRHDALTTPTKKNITYYKMRFYEKYFINE